MEDQEYDLIEEMQESHWWWLGRQRIIERLIQKYCYDGKPLMIADVGSGLGANIPMLLRYGKVTALEPSDAAVAKIAANWSPRRSVLVVKWRCPQPMNVRFDLILLADVLEHIPDDTGAVDWVWDHLNPGGHVIITVPAHAHLWTEMDEVVHHQRRYRSADLRRLFSRRFFIRRFSFYDLALYPVKLLFVAFSKMRRAIHPQRPKRSFNETPPRLINQVFKSILSIEARIISRVPLPFGVSLVVVAQRPRTAS